MLCNPGSNPLSYLDIDLLDIKPEGIISRIYSVLITALYGHDVAESLFVHGNCFGRLDFSLHTTPKTGPERTAIRDEAAPIGKRTTRETP